MATALSLRFHAKITKDLKTRRACHAPWMDVLQWATTLWSRRIRSLESFTSGPLEAAHFVVCYLLKTAFSIFNKMLLVSASYAKKVFKVQILSM